MSVGLRSGCCCIGLAAPVEEYCQAPPGWFDTPRFALQGNMSVTSSGIAHLCAAVCLCLLRQPSRLLLAQLAAQARLMCERRGVVSPCCSLVVVTQALQLPPR